MDVRRLDEMQAQGRSIFDTELAVAYYARVSTDKDEQINSLGNQKRYFEDCIAANPHWTFAGGYVDEGISGTSVEGREQFLRMIEDAKRGRFDLIITKEISRFARNTLDSLSYTRELLRFGVGVYFQNDNINTFDKDAELRLTIMSSIAQDELRKLSSRVKFGHQQAIKQSVVLGNSRIFGYTKRDGRLIVDEEEAVMVRELFELYATDQYSMKQLENLFWEKGYRNHNGRKIAHTTMSGMISNPKYKGYYVGNKVRIVDMFTKKQKFLPPEEWVMFKDESGEIVPAIVSEELWDAANAVLTRRSKDVKRRQNLCNHDNLLTGKLYCTHCGAAYYRRDAKDRKGSVNSKWVCSGKIKNGKDSCPSLPLYEQELRPVLMDVFKEADVNANELIERYIEMYRAISQDDTDLAQEIDTQRTRRELAEKKKSKLLEYNVTGQITDADFLKMNRQCDNEIDECTLCLEELEAARTSRADLNAHIAEIRRVLQAARDDAVNGLMGRDFVQKYIDRIFVTTDNDKIQLQIKLFTNESTMRYLEKLERRSGHTFKKMIESYEQSLAAKG